MPRSLRVLSQFFTYTTYWKIQTLKLQRLYIMICYYRFCNKTAHVGIHNCVTFDRLLSTFFARPWVLFSFLSAGGVINDGTKCSFRLNKGHGSNRITTARVTFRPSSYFLLR
jgi:hypothetical protein